MQILIIKTKNKGTRQINLYQKFYVKISISIQLVDCILQLPWELVAMVMLLVFEDLGHL